MDETLRHGQGALPDVNRQDELPNGVHRHPDPVRRARQTLDRLGLGHLTVFDGTEQGEEFVHLHLLNVDIAQEMAREGLQVLGCLDQPGQDRVGIDLEDPGYGADAQTLSQSRDGPYQLVGSDLLAVKRRARSFQEISPDSSDKPIAASDAHWDGRWRGYCPSQPSRDRSSRHAGRSGRSYRPDGDGLG